jgi:hypothetical protein
MRKKMKLSLWNVWKNNFYVRTVTVERLIELRELFFEEMQKDNKRKSGMCFAINELQLAICEIRGDPESHWKTPIKK